MRYLRGEKNIGKDDLGFPVGGEVIRIVPVLIGSKRRDCFKQFLEQLLLLPSAVGSYFVPGNPVSAFGYKMGAAA